MSTHFDRIPAAIPAIAPEPSTPQPGEIWQIRSIDPTAPILLQRHFVNVMVVDTLPRGIRVMLLSRAVAFQSDIDILVPRSQSGDSQDVIALTWQVLSVALTDLIQPTGIRWSRAIYDCLLDIGDRHHNLNASIADPADYGLGGGTAGSHQSAAIQTFHAQQRTIAQRLSQNFQRATHEFHAQQAMAQLLEAAAQQTMDLASLPQVQPNVQPSLINLSHWLASHIGQPIVTGWEQLRSTALMPQLVPALRSQPTPPDEATIAALIAQLQTTTDDETLWATVESLWKLDPGNPAAGVRRVKLVDLGMQVAGEPVALAVAIVPRGASRAVLLQVYPTGNAAYLPENLQLILLDETGQVLRQIAARTADIYVQLKLSGAPGERFSVRVALGESSLTEHFSM